MNPSMKVPLFPVLTQQKQARFSWIVLINLSWFIGLYSGFVFATVLPFTLRRFTDDLRLISLVTSVGLWFGIVLGPLVNYMSDRIWTRFGRRRPFLLVATCGSLMAAFCIPFMPALIPLILLVVVSSILGDVGSTQEPLWMEVVPPEQRGTGFAIRTMMTKLASLVFFQIMFAQMDSLYSLPMGGVLTGEHVCYLSAGVLQLGYLVFLLFFLREVKPDNLAKDTGGESFSSRWEKEARSLFGESAWWHFLLWSPLPVPVMMKMGGQKGMQWIYILLFPVTYFTRFFRDVFGEKRWWWVYLFCVTPKFVTEGGGFATLMLVEQFHYSKQNIALLGLPSMILSLCLITPFMAWFADRLPRFHWIVLGGIVAVSTGMLCWFLQAWQEVPKLELPPFWAMMVIGVLTELASGALIIWIFQVLRGWHSQTNPRLWAWVLRNLKAFGLVVLTFVTIKIFSGEQIPSMTTWLILSHIAVGISCLDIVAGPLLYDLIPKDKLGTLSSGFGLLGTLVQAFISTLVGTWIFYASSWTSGGETTSDYSTFYTMQMTLGLITLWMTFLFAKKLLRGTMVEYGRLVLNSSEVNDGNRGGFP